MEFSNQHSHFAENDRLELERHIHLIWHWNLSPHRCRKNATPRQSLSVAFRLISPHFQPNSSLFPGGLSIPSAVLADEHGGPTLYGYIATGWSSDDKVGVWDGFSRWGLKGENEVSEGLSAVYKFETKINSANADLAGGRLSYVGLSGGFGTVALGQVWSAANSHVGFLDNAPFLGDNELVGRTGNTVSYSASVGAVSFQIDAQGGQGMADKDIDSAGFGATVKIGDSGKIALGYTDYATMGKDTPKYAVPSKWTNADGEACVASDVAGVLQCDYHPAVAASKDQDEHLDGDAQAVLAGQYTIGGVTMHLGYGERKKDTDSKAAVHATGNDWKAATHFGTDTATGGYARKRT